MLKTIYNTAHFLINYSWKINPFIKKKWNGKPISWGHISSEHFKNSQLDDQLYEEIKNKRLPTKEMSIDKADYLLFVGKAKYQPSYYGGGQDTSQNFIEKSLEHYLSTKFINFNTETVFIDIAAATSPFSKIVQQLFGVRTSYCQDLVFKKGLHGNKIGGFASEIPLADNSVDAVTLHCSLEHFEGNSDIKFFKEMQRVLKPDGKIVILPFYLAYEYSIHIDPAFNFLKFHRPILDKNARLRYCDWKQYFSRHYDIDTLINRIIKNCPLLKPEIIRINNYQEIDKTVYLRWVGIFTKS